MAGGRHCWTGQVRVSQRADRTLEAWPKGPRLKPHLYGLAFRGLEGLCSLRGVDGLSAKA
jgi:hypothetical protein